MAKKKATKKKAAKRKSAAKKPAMEMLLVGSKAKAHGVNVAGDALENLNFVVYWYIEQAAKRAEANGRKTVRAHDFMVG